MLNLREADVTQTCFYQEVLEISKQQRRLLGNHYGQEIGRQVGWKEGRLNSEKLYLSTFVDNHRVAM